MSKYLYIVFSMIAALLVVSAGQAGSLTQVEGATTVDGATAKSLFDRGVPFVDVRSEKSFNAGHVSSAVHLGMAFTKSDLAEVASKDQEVVIYCDGPGC